MLAVAAALLFEEGTVAVGAAGVVAGGAATGAALTNPRATNGSKEAGTAAGTPTWTCPDVAPPTALVDTVALPLLSREVGVVTGDDVGILVFALPGAGAGAGAGVGAGAGAGAGVEALCALDFLAFFAFLFCFLPRVMKPPASKLSSVVAPLLLEAPPALAPPPDPAPPKSSG